MLSNTRGISAVLTWLFIIWGSLNLFILNGYFSLWDQDESAYAGFALQMIETGNWSIPEFLWSEPHRKTPFHFWTIAVSYKIFGVNEFAVRFPGGLAIMLTWLCTYFMGRRVFGHQAAVTAVLLLCASLFLPHLGKISVTDAVLLSWQTMAALGIICFMHEPKKRWLFAVWLGVAGGVMTKGPPVLMLAGGMAFILLIFHPNRWRLLRLHPWFFLPLALLPLYFWGRQAWQYDDGVFVMWMLDWYILDRAKGGVAFGQTGPPGYFLALFILSFLPFLPLFFKSLGVMLKKGVFNSRRNINYLYFFAWFVPSWFLYEFIPSKLPSYALAAMPGIALLMGYYLQNSRFLYELNSTSNKLFASFGLLLAIGIAIGLPLGLNSVIDIGFQPLLYSALGIWLLFSILQLVFIFKKKALMWYQNGMIIGLFFVSVGWLLAVPLLEPARSATKKAANVVIDKPNIEKVYLDIPYPLPSLPFYLHTKKISYTDIRHEAGFENFTTAGHAWITDSERFQERKNYLTESVVLQNYDTYEIDGWISDKGRWLTYIVVVKK
ncbi:MAG: glycosyltransferase family 39 protein [Chitinophagaceae bacterium]|nr:MAG: glycosyltransferase family 39 protein [Chitinophagaceae bacterium]